MFDKIDKKLFNHISAMGIVDRSVDVIVMLKNFDNRYLNNELINKNTVICELPIVSGLVVRTNYSNITKIANSDNVMFISSNSKVCGMINKSKKIINIDKLPTGRIGTHSCVVIDTGIYPHIDFCLGKNRILKFVDLINYKEYLYDDNGHGTFVTGIMAGNSITNKYTGIDNKCNIIVIKALDSVGETSTVKILEAMQWVLENKEKYNIKIVCMSFGSEVANKVDPLIYGAEILWDNGIVVVSAAGNDGPESETIMSPGASKKIITVGSMFVNESGKMQIANFSSRGPVDNYFKPDLLAPGVDVISTNVFSKDNKFYTSMSGTSVSTPIVAGVISLILNINPKYSPDQIKYMLLNSCLEITGDRNAEGCGTLDLSKLNLIY